MIELSVGEYLRKKCAIQQAVQFATLINLIFQYKTKENIKVLDYMADENSDRFIFCL